MLQMLADNLGWRGLSNVTSFSLWREVFDKKCAVTMLVPRKLLLYLTACEQGCGVTLATLLINFWGKVSSYCCDFQEHSSLNLH